MCTIDQFATESNAHFILNKGEKGAGIVRKTLNPALSAIPFHRRSNSFVQAH